MVEGQNYLWRLRGRRRFLGNAYPHPTLSVQIVGASPGRVLQCSLKEKQFDGHEADMDCGEVCQAAVTPKDVAKVILHARAAGWDPKVKGAPFKLAGPLDLKDYTVEV